MRPEAGQVCQSLIVVSYCTPGSAQAHAAYAIFSHRSRAAMARSGLPSVRRNSTHSPSSMTLCMKSSVTRTELFEFCPDTVT